MIAKADLTDDQIRQLRKLSADGLKKTHAAEKMGIDVNWLNRSAERTGFKAELDELFPTRIPRDHKITDKQMDHLRILASAGLRPRAACAKLGSTPETMRAAAERAGRYEEFIAIFPASKRRPKVREILPRDVDPVVQALIKPWRKAA